MTTLIPTWRRPEELGRCIAALETQSRLPDQIIVVVRHDDADTWSFLRQRASDGLVVQSIRAEFPGVVASLNAGLDAATGAIVAVTDDDSVPRRDWLARLVDTFTPDVGGVGGRDWVHYDDQLIDGQEECVGRILRSGRLIGNHHLGVGAPRQVDVLKGVNMAFRREALNGIRLDPELRGSGMQMHWEIGLCLAVKRAGWKLIYDPAIAVDHFPAARLDEAQRHELSPAALSNEVFNATIGLLKGLPAARKPGAFAFGLLVGTRQAPGPMVALERRARGHKAGRALAASTVARVQALAAYLAQTGPPS